MIHLCSHMSHLDIDQAKHHIRLCLQIKMTCTFVLNTQFSNTWEIHLLKLCEVLSWVNQCMKKFNDYTYQYNEEEDGPWYSFQLLQGILHMGDPNPHPQLRNRKASCTSFLAFRCCMCRCFGTWNKDPYDSLQQQSIKTDAIKPHRIL